MTAVLFLERRVVKQLLDQVDVSKQHPSTTVALQTKCVKRVTAINEQLTTVNDGHSRVPQATQSSLPFGVLSLQQTKVSFPFVADDLATGEASDWDDHDYGNSVIARERVETIAINKRGAVSCAQSSEQRVEGPRFECKSTMHHTRTVQSFQ